MKRVFCFKVLLFFLDKITFMNKVYLYFFGVLLFLVLVVFVFEITNKKPDLEIQPIENVPVVVDNPELNQTELTSNQKENEPVVAEEAQKNEILPNKAINSVPFTSQAPYAKWDNLHDEACEEASIIMAHYYLIEEEKIDISLAEEEIQSMVKSQISYLGSHKDLNANEMVELAKKFYNEEYQVVKLIKKDAGEVESENKDLDIVYEEKIEFLKSELAKGNIFIIPAAGQELGNPYFRGDGPLYHALVIIGYDDSSEEFITNDPGTRRGEKYRYSYEVIWDAIHDFPGKKTDILKGDKNVILVEKKID
jgi:nitrogen regulatory protein PII